VSYGNKVHIEISVVELATPPSGSFNKRSRDCIL
jgi:hypothetical protein